MKSVIRGAGYVLAHTPDMVLHNGTTQTTERIVNPDSEYLKELPSHIRSFEQAVAYWPNQVYIGNKTPDELAAVAQPWCDKECDCHERYGKVRPDDAPERVPAADAGLRRVRSGGTGGRIRGCQPGGVGPPTPSWSRACWTA